jgi:hypothetical protein
VVDEGITNALIVSLDVAPAAYNFGLELTVKIANTNTGPATVNVNGLGVKTIKRADGSPILAGDLPRLHGQADLRRQRLQADRSDRELDQRLGRGCCRKRRLRSSFGDRSGDQRNGGGGFGHQRGGERDCSSGFGGRCRAGGYRLSPARWRDNDGRSDAIRCSDQQPSCRDQEICRRHCDCGGLVHRRRSFNHARAGAVLADPDCRPARARQRLGRDRQADGPDRQPARQLPARLHSSTGGLCPPTSGAVGAFLRSDATWQQITTVSGNAGTATKLATARTIAISGAVTGTGTAFDGSANITIPITALDVGAATTGVLAVARGGTGVTTSTGSGSNVLSNRRPSPARPQRGDDPHQRRPCWRRLSPPTAATEPGSFYSTSGTRYLAYDGANYVFNSALVGLAAPPAGNSNVWAVNSAWVQNELTSYSKALLTITSISSDRTIANGDNNALLQCTGGTEHTLTAGNLNTGLSVLIAVTGSVAWTFSCAGGVYLRLDVDRDFGFNSRWLAMHRDSPWRRRLAAERL